jgi:UDP-2,4-diacetamido-2,4,6-trideoxy-beta-L-altropyranose hydrolase
VNDFKEYISLRKAVHNDEKLIFNWVNDPEVRKWSFNKKIILLDDHKIWFEKKIQDPNLSMWIFEVNKSPMGLIRLEKDKEDIALHYLLAPKSRGKGLASKMLTISLKEIKKYKKKVFAYTLPGNIASIKSLKKAGFSCVHSSNEKNSYVYII